MFQIYVSAISLTPLSLNTTLEAHKCMSNHHVNQNFGTNLEHKGFLSWLARDSSVTKISSTPKFENLPTELIIMIAMFSGFFGAIQLGQTSVRFRQIIDDPKSWLSYNVRSPDIIHYKVTLGTKLHQFDQIIFAEWPVNDIKNVPCIIHRTFLEQYDFLGGISLQVQPSGAFFDHRERLPCYVTDVKQQLATGKLPPMLSISEASPVGGIRIQHSCNECNHYDKQVVLCSEFVNGSLTEEQELTFTYVIDQCHHVTVAVQSISGIFGYQSDIPCVTTQLWRLNGKVLNPGYKKLYMKYISNTL